MPDRTLTITVHPDSGVYRATVEGGPSATGASHYQAALNLMAKVAEHGWATPEPTLTPSETDATNPADS